ncbi:MAG: MATE family efflux transporter, partial [Eubacteriales bacterium]
MKTKTCGKIALSDHFTFSRLLRFVTPSIAMMICTSLYSIVDGFFVSNYVGKTAFAAVNLIMPVIMAVGAVGFMIGTGGSAIVSRTLGEGKQTLAKRYFSMMVYAAVGISLVLSVIGFVLMPQIAALLGAEGELAGQCVIYGRILFVFNTAFALQSIFQAFFVTAEKPQLSLRISVAAGITNMILDFVFIGVLKWGIAGAALATGIGEMVGGVLPLFYFAAENSSLLRLVKTGLQGKIL